jgi:hypothetical protein
LSININEHTIEELSKAYHQYDLNGGSLQFSIWKLNESQEPSEELTPYNTHKVVARQAVEKLNYETAKRWNSVVTKDKRSEFPILQIDYDQLDGSGIELSCDDFLGYAYDWEHNKPIIKGINQGAYWNFDSHQRSESRIKLHKLGVIHNSGFVQAFLFPPYAMKLGESKSDVEKYFNEFSNLFFDDLKKLKIFSWSVDCTYFFKPGKEWWGSYFWTVYNPIKDIYIGILGSDTD